MIKIGDIVKLKNPKSKRDAKRRWRYVALNSANEHPNFRRIDTATHRLEHIGSPFVPISFWERITKRY